MATEADIDDLWRDLRPLLVSAYKRGFKAGAEAQKAELFALLRDVPDPTFIAPEASAGSSEKPRAPKGRVSDAIKAAFEHSNEMTLKEVQAFVFAFDPRISQKTVYNELWRSDGFEQREGRWCKLHTAPSSPPGSPKGETEASRPRLLFRARPLQGATPSGDTAPTVSKAGGT